MPWEPACLIARPRNGPSVTSLPFSRKCVEKYHRESYVRRWPACYSAGIDSKNQFAEYSYNIIALFHTKYVIILFPDGRSTRYRSYRSIFPLLFFAFPRLLKYYLYSIHSLFVWRECLAHQVPIVLTVLSFRFSGLCLMVVNATIHFHGQASPVGVWSFLRLPLNPSREKKKEKTKKEVNALCSPEVWQQRALACG